MDGQIVEQITGEQTESLRQLWEEVFSEDRGAFADYYFEYKAKDNRAFLIRDKESGGPQEAAAMLHLTPYRLCMRTGSLFNTIASFYIVGVATKEAFRHQGLMDRLLREAFQSMYAEGIPFTFLMPASPAIYRPYEFAYIYERTEYEWRLDRTWTAGEKVTCGGYTVAPFQEADMGVFLDFVNEELKRRCDVFTVRDEAYYKRMVLEQKALCGGVYLIWEEEPGAGKKICGYFLLAKEEKAVIIQEAILPSSGFEAIREAGKKPVIMARIIHAEAMLSMLRTKSGQITISLRLNDPQLAENNDCFECEIGMDFARITRRAEQAEKSARMPETKVSLLTAWIFGGSTAEACFGALTETQRKAFERICTFDKVYLNELV